jgi:hypothetical protein
MTMRRSAALDAALALVERPAAVRYAITAPLPSGVVSLLQVAAGDSAALRFAEAMTGQSRAALQAAAGFFIEQILFHPQADYYRTLGASRSAPRSELRQNMALLVKWLHPDGREQRVARSDLDRGIFIHRVTQAWENLKTDERRTVYDQKLASRKAEKRQATRRSRARKTAHKPKAAKLVKQASRNLREKLAKGGRFRRLVVLGFEHDSFLSRVFSSLWLRT